MWARRDKNVPLVRYADSEMSTADMTDGRCSMLWLPVFTEVK